MSASGLAIACTLRWWPATGRGPTNPTGAVLSSAKPPAQRSCVKRDASKGVCTINSPSNGARQDWLVCPYRALNRDLIAGAIQRLFGLRSAVSPWVVPAITMTSADVRAEVVERVSAGEAVFVYFDAKLGGELSVPQTDRSPELSFDVTIIEVVAEDRLPRVGQVGILKIQTMDFHGSYRTAVRNLTEGLRMHGDRFGETLAGNQRWLSEGVAGPISPTSSSAPSTR